MGTNLFRYGGTATLRSDMLVLMTRGRSGIAASGRQVCGCWLWRRQQACRTICLSCGSPVDMRTVQMCIWSLQKMRYVHKRLTLRISAHTTQRNESAHDTERNGVKHWYRTDSGFTHWRILCYSWRGENLGVGTLTRLWDVHVFWTIGLGIDMWAEHTSALADGLKYNDNKNDL